MCTAPSWYIVRRATRSNPGTGIMLMTNWPMKECRFCPKQSSILIMIIPDSVTRKGYVICKNILVSRRLATNQGNVIRRWLTMVDPAENGRRRGSVIGIDEVMTGSNQYV